jgi:3-isopropylmalate/(R)-2-methylmalate dehydratase small subunit
MGRIWKLGDNIDTDALAPGRFMHRPIAELAENCLIDVSPDFAKNATIGDVIVAGRNFGLGSSREQAAQALKIRGLQGVVAESFAGIFYRNAINLGLPVFVIRGGEVSPREGLQATLDPDAATLHHDDGETLLEPLPDFLLDLLHDGGLVPHLEKRFAKEGQKT